MVLFYDLSADDAASNPPPHWHMSQQQPDTTKLAPPERLNREHPLSRLLAAYPFLAGMGRWLDHTDLESLSGACWQFRENMGGYRAGLLRGSLRCCSDSAAGAKPVNDGRGLGRELGLVHWRSVRAGSRCVRDMVRGCVKCGVPYCRNCIRKIDKAALACRVVPPCMYCEQLPADPALPVCACTTATWICAGCADVRRSRGSTLCLLCERTPTKLHVWGARDLRRREVCAWCKGMVWGVEDAKVLEEMGASAAAGEGAVGGGCSSSSSSSRQSL